MSSSHRVRRDRMRAKRIGLVLSQSGEAFYLLNEDGVRVTTGTIEQVEEWMNERTPAWAPGPLPEPIPEVWLPWMKMFTAEQKAAKRTARTITTRWAHLGTFARRHPDLSPLEVTRADLINYFAGGEEHWQPRTVHAMQSTFRLFFRLLVQEGHRRDDPTRSLPHVRIPRSLPRPCPDDVLAEALTSVTDHRLRLAIRLAADTGMRRSEIARAKRSDIEGGPGDYRIHVIGKGGHERVVPISDELAARVLASSAEYLFPSKFRDVEGHITGQRLGKLMTEALPGGWSAHSLRHRFGTVAYESTGDIRAVQDLLGHASPVTTAIYTRVTDKAMKRAAEAARFRAVDRVDPPAE